MADGSATAAGRTSDGASEEKIWGGSTRETRDASALDPGQGINCVLGLPTAVLALLVRSFAADPLSLRHLLLLFFLHQFARLDPQCLGHLADGREASWSVAGLQVADRRLGYAGHSPQVLLAYGALHSQLPQPGAIYAHASIHTMIILWSCYMYKWCNNKVFGEGYVARSLRHQLHPQHKIAPANPSPLGPGLRVDLSSPSYKRALGFEPMGCVMRYAQNSFPSLCTPSLDRLLELSPRAPFLSPRSHQPTLRFYLVHHHSGTSGLEGPDPDKHLAHVLSLHPAPL